MNSIESWIKVLGTPNRIGKYKDVYFWDNNGFLLTIDKNTKKVDTTTIQFLDYYEIFPVDKELGKPAGTGGILVSHFKDIIQIEDGYLAREVLREEFKKRAFPNSYWYMYKLKGDAQFNVIHFTHDGRAKYVSIY